ncbi:putative coiled-coil domain-containing protein [Apostichopus japonicus]|uniref:Putative coiled-coil domain-containing protein n=1 Tax=Stichopus japonicus TaxID=307972 RepID=A0A2G8LGY8_STIJA|nr:putative coiled-coil domain-containing protein [Apostichopus japonicus]
MPVAVAQRTHASRFKDRKVKQHPKQTHFGIEVAKGLVWKEWEPGGEYTKHVILKNVNVKTQKFKYSSPNSRFFSTLYPEPIVLSAGTSFKLPVTFRPLEKNIYEDSIEFYTQDGSFNVPIVAVLPRYVLSLPEHLNFGMCASQYHVDRTFELKNVSELKTEFQWLVGLPFTLEPSSGCLEPKSKCTIIATFKPTASLVYETVAECLFGDKLACKKTLNLEGIGKFPHLLVSPDGKIPNASDSLGLESIISFGEVAIGATGSRCIELHNLSPVNAPFTIKHPSAKIRMDTVFQCTEQDGIAPAQSICKIPVNFTPNNVLEESVDYLEVHAISSVSKMTVKLTGKCKGPKVSLGNRVLDFGRINSGDTSTCPLKIINNSDVAAAFQDPLFVDLIGTCHTELAKPAILQPKHLDRYRIHEARGFSVFPPELPLHVSMDVEEVDFGCCVNLQHVEQRTINVTNHTKGKITVVWMGESDHIFSVTPTSSDVPPLKMTSFRVSFKPDAPNQFYGSELEGYAFYKSMRDYRLVQDETFAPPWCLTVSAVGSTFQPGHETFLPGYTMDNTRLVFPAVDVGDSIYKTLLLNKTGDTPYITGYQMIPISIIFQVKPRLGLIQAKHQLFAVRKSPRELNTKLNHSFRWLLNESEKHTLDILVQGSSEQPAVLLDSQGVLYFKPTCVGTSSSRTYKVKNISRVPLRFEWIFAHADKRYLKVEPRSGIIQLNESQPHVWCFTPTKEEKYVFKPYMQIEDVKHIGDLKRRKRVSVRVIGEGSIGDITAEEPSIDLAYIVVGTAVSKDLVLYNNSVCTLHYKLCVEQTLEGSYAEEVAQSEAVALELDTYHGIIPARSRCLVQATIRPRHRLNYTFNVSYELCTPELNQDEEARITGSRKPLCEMKVVGCTLLYRSQMLVAMVALVASELNYVTPTRHSTTRKVATNTRAVMDYNFSSAPVGSEPCMIHLMLENKGTVATDWAFLFPTDMHLELEYWAETGEFDMEELHEMRVMDNKLFSIEPRQGQLAPGQEQAISFSYRHEFAGTDRLPVMFKVSRGREILLNFVGVTIDPERKYVHFPTNKHMFQPVPIGNANNPHQVYEMYNGGALPVEYYLDLTSLEILQKENFDQRILDCLNPKGEIGPGKTANIEWIFSPMESKTYTVSVPIHIIGGDTALISFSGVGYDSRSLGKTLPATDESETLVPVAQKVPIPGQLVYLSQERISFGNMPVFTQSRRVIYIKNNSPNHAVSFEWFVQSEADGLVIDIQPASAPLEPGESCMCKVCFTAIGEPTFYDIDVICEITDEQVVSEFQAELADWEKERERQKYEFTITEDSMREPASRERLCDTIKAAESGHKSSSPDEFKKYNTLPPIKNVLSDKELAIRSVKERQTENGTPLWAKPAPPEPFVLHLGVTGRTLDVSEFQSNFPNEVGGYYIDRSMGDRLRPSSQVKGKEEKGEADSVNGCSEQEQDVIEGTVANIIRALLDDHDFLKALEEIQRNECHISDSFGEVLRACPELEMPDSSHPSEGSLSVDREVAVQSVTFMDDTIMKRDSKGADTLLRDWTSPMEIESVPPPPRGYRCHHEQESFVRVCPSGHTDLDYQQSLMEEKLRNEQQVLKRCPEFGMLLESILENTIFNVMSESLRREVNLQPVRD